MIKAYLQLCKDYVSHKGVLGSQSQPEPPTSLLLVGSCVSNLLQMSEKEGRRRNRGEEKRWGEEFMSYISPNASSK